MKRQTVRAWCDEQGGKLQYLLLALAVTLAPVPALAQTKLADTEFDLANDWTVFGPWINPADARNGDFIAQQRLEGGLPGAYLELTHTLPTVSSGSVGSWAALIFEKYAWNPSGYCDALDFRIDARRVGDSYSRVFTLAIRQEAFVWAAIDKRVFLNADGWTALSVENLSALDFVPFPYVNDANQPFRPDFTTGAAPIYVGIATGLSCPSTSDCTPVVPKQSDIDNFAVDTFCMNPGLNDAWYNPTTAGQGFLITVFPEIQQMFLAWFTFDTERPPADVEATIGEPGHRWLTAQGPYAGGKGALSIYLTEGGVFDAADPPASNDGIADGSMTIEFADCTDGLVSYEIDSAGLSGQIPIQRITNDNVALCQALTGQ